MKIIMYFNEKLRNFNIVYIYNNNSDYLWAYIYYNRLFMHKIV